MLTRPNVLIFLLEYIDIFTPSVNMKQLFGRAALFFTIIYVSQHCILSIATVAD